nr:MAG: hypothetical protein [Apis mellifra filamentous-like virus]
MTDQRFAVLRGEKTMYDNGVVYAVVEVLHVVVLRANNGQLRGHLIDKLLKSVFDLLQAFLRFADGCCRVTAARVLSLDRRELSIVVGVRLVEITQARLDKVVQVVYIFRRDLILKRRVDELRDELDVVDDIVLLQHVDRLCRSLVRDRSQAYAVARFGIGDGDGALIKHRMRMRFERLRSLNFQLDAVQHTPSFTLYRLKVGKNHSPIAIGQVVRTGLDHLLGLRARHRRRLSRLDNLLLALVQLLYIR